ncbi:glycerol-3-phosphate dehydrogenase [Geosmithia morbida]|uniref:Glycerol-3-phosphate dehydrogenase n=1 Tax=Geosmithia morbida TaxID=1094350 RepID=A0A9P5D317_9HYPO|nr:glycerol-3-phosphate dehydrogenase [Geosmithia morbida]KAF4122071.1 glycerol-3-phosphate dehydrogenase [Geosmithia morbida]
MASRLRNLRRPLGLAAATTAAVVVGGSGYMYVNRRRHPVLPLAEVKRDASGKIIAPSFPTIKSRVDQLAELRRSSSSADSEEYDLLIVGGGATGTGIAVDAVTRGLKVAMVERDDFSSGTSSKSTKLVHGGVRYLEKAVLNLDYAQLELVIEALRERRTLLDNAPHLASSLPILLPLQKWWEAPYMWVGTKMYDLLAGSQALESSYYVGRSDALSMFPRLRKDNVVGGLVYYDGQQNDSRMNISLAMTAAAYGATVANHVEVTSLEKGADGKICGAKLRDVLPGADGSEFTVRAKGVINATGPFADALQYMDKPDHKPIVAPASGVHLVLPGDVCPNGMGLLEASSDGRVVFVLPWQGKTVAGTTDTACEVEREPLATEKDVDFILEEVNKLLKPGSSLGRDDVLASWSGIRPLVRDPNAKNTESLVRNHLVTVSPSGLLTCAGGKWTTYRQMAQDAVDEAIRTFDLKPKTTTLADISGAGLPAITTDGACRTLETPVVGAHGWSPALASQLAEAHGLPADVAQHLATNYGDRAWAVAALPGATTRLLADEPFVEAELRHGVRSEAGCTTSDLIARRTRLAFLDVNSAVKALPRVVDVAAEELGWSAARKDEEWSTTLSFMRSMGLSADRVDLTRAQVEGLSPRVEEVHDDHKPEESFLPMPVRGPSPVPSGSGGVVTLPDLGNTTATAKTRH